MNVDIKFVRKKGFDFNKDDSRVTYVINGLIENQGHCPTKIKNRNGHDQCPCSDYLQNNICHCKLYVKENEED